MINHALPDWRRRPVKSYLDGVVGAIGTLLGAALAAWAAVKVATINNKKPTVPTEESAYHEGLLEFSRSAEALKDYFGVGVERAIFWEGRNGGGIPNFGSPYFATAIQFAVILGHDPSMIRSYRELPVDGPYCTMLTEGMKVMGRPVVLDTSTMEPGLLRDLYQAEGVFEGMIIVHGLYQNKLYYTSLSNYSRKFTPQEVTRAEILAHAFWREFLIARGAMVRGTYELDGGS
jgi:hypothetical protein